MTESDVTHSAFSDEAYYVSSRYRSIALVSLEKSHIDSISSELDTILSESGMTEFKWLDLGGARERFTAIKLIDRAIELTLAGIMRIDVLIWDIEDSRHSIRQRDDQTNLQRMYFHLFDSTIRIRWPSNSIWELFPDEQSAIDWPKMIDVLIHSGSDFRIQRDLFSPDQFRYGLFHNYKIRSIQELDSHDNPLIQVADLFAGIGAYSYSCHDKYVHWERDSTGQIAFGLFENEEIQVEISNRDSERCRVISHLNSICKKHKLSVSLKSKSGFFTFTPDNPINFWMYEPQHPDDQAPTLQ